MAVEWVRKPFILRPERKKLELWRDVLTTKYSRAWTEMFEDRMKQSGRELGIQFDFNGHVGNSFESLRLIHWVADCYPSKQEVLTRILSRNHFEKNLCVGELSNLLKACEEANIPIEEAERVLSSDQYKDELQKEIQETARVTHSIPLVTLHWKNKPSEGVMIQGAESEETIRRTISQFLNSHAQ
mmetsp:Transcript_7888/g.9783  ORF Transcript_7888/g.9783 Transcript_7888/m.9783 type:complete len:185 (-) Transcript_7888:1779-2333(-)